MYRHFRRSIYLLFNGRTASSKHLRLGFHRGSDFKDETEVWILLSRHIVETRRASEFIALKVEMLDAGLGNEDQKVVDSMVSHFLSKPMDGT